MLDVAVTQDTLLIPILVSVSSLADLTNTTITIQDNVSVVEEVSLHASPLFALEDTLLMRSTKYATDAKIEFNTTMSRQLLVLAAHLAQTVVLLMTLASFLSVDVAQDILLMKLTKSAIDVHQPNTMISQVEHALTALNSLLAAHLTMASSVSVDADLAILLIQSTESAINLALHSNTTMHHSWNVFLAQVLLLAADLMITVS